MVIRLAGHVGHGEVHRGAVGDGHCNRHASVSAAKTTREPSERWPLATVAPVSRRSDLQVVARSAAACSSSSLWPGREAGVCGGVCCGLWFTAGLGPASGRCAGAGGGTQLLGDVSYRFTNAPSWFYQSPSYWGNMKGN